jgi:hypothetical protein
VQFALELYLHRQPESQSEVVARARSLTAAARRARVPLTFLRSIYLPDDEVCFLIFEARSAEAIAKAARNAEIAFERIVEATLVQDIAPTPQASIGEAARTTARGEP